MTGVTRIFEAIPSALDICEQETCLLRSQVLRGVGPKDDTYAVLFTGHSKVTGQVIGGRLQGFTSRRQAEVFQHLMTGEMIGAFFAALRAGGDPDDKG